MHRRPTAFAAALRSNRALTASEKESGRIAGEAPLEPFLHPTCVGCRRSFLQPNLPLGTGNRRRSHLGGEVSSPSLPGKTLPGESRTGMNVLYPLSYLPVDGREGRSRTGDHALMKRSNPDLTAWENGARRRIRTGLEPTYKVGASLPTPGGHGRWDRSCTCTGGLPTSF